MARAASKSRSPVRGRRSAASSEAVPPSTPVVASSSRAFVAPSPRGRAGSSAARKPGALGQLLDTVPGWLLALLVLVFPGYLMSLYWDHPVFKSHLLPASALAILSFVVTWYMIPFIAAYNLKAGLFGKDINKRGMGEAGEVPVPESLGIVPGLVFLIAVILFQGYRWVLPEAQTVVDYYDSALTSVCFMLLLGFIDDVLDIPWRYKLILPLFASLPLVFAYGGITQVILPVIIRPYFARVIELGILYKVYMALLAIFCSNCINIYAGINGLEAGQSFVIAATVLSHNLIELTGASQQHFQFHILSVSLMLPFIGSTLGLLWYNFYPSKVFVGDSFTYFSGMVFAVAGILGHFSKTLMLFFIPQILNFVISLPQLLKIIPCPRHRLPNVDPATGLLTGIPTNLNLVNQTLILLGPMTERRLCVVLLAFQVACSLLGIYVRYPLARLLFDE